MARPRADGSRKGPARTREPADRPPARTLDVTIVLPEGGYASTAIGPIEVFHSAGQLWDWLHGTEGAALRPRFRVRTASVDGGSVMTICGLKLTPEFAIADIEETDIVIVSAPGWDVLQKIARESALIPWLQRCHARGAYVAATCTASAFLAESGLLDGKKATTHWAMAEQYRERYPGVDWRTEQFVTEDRRVLCSGGIYSSIDLSLYLVEKFCGHEVALQCAKSLLVSMPRGRQSGYSVLPLSRSHTDEKIRKAEEYLHQHFAAGVAIERLSSRLGMSPRNFIRRFKAATGRLPGAYLQQLRISAAKELLEQGRTPVEHVCKQVGYEDLAFFRNLFKRHTGMTPTEYRSHFAPMSVDRGELATGRTTPGDEDVARPAPIG